MNAHKFTLEIMVLSIALERSFRLRLKNAKSMRHCHLLLRASISINSKVFSCMRERKPFLCINQSLETAAANGIRFSRVTYEQEEVSYLPAVFLNSRWKKSSTRCDNEREHTKRMTKMKMRERYESQTSLNSFLSVTTFNFLRRIISFLLEKNIKNAPFKCYKLRR